MRLKHITDASVEIILVPRVPPKRTMPHREQIVHEFCNGAVKMLHERTEVFTALHITEDVIVIDEEGDDPWIEIEFLAAVVENGSRRFRTQQVI